MSEDENIEDTDLEDLLSDDDDFQDMLDEEDDLDSDLSDFDEDVDSLDGFTEEESFAEEDSLHLTNEETTSETKSQTAESEAPIDEAEPTAESTEEIPPEEPASMEETSSEDIPKDEALEENTPPEAEQTSELEDTSSGLNAPEQEEPTHVETTTSDIDMEPLESVALTLTVELSRIQIPIKKVLEMRPGNLIDMQMPEQGYVDLVISGKKVGQGELIKLGDVMGIRILEMGTKSF